MASIAGSPRLDVAAPYSRDDVGGVMYFLKLWIRFARDFCLSFSFVFSDCSLSRMHSA